MGYRGELCQWEDRCDPTIPLPRHEVLPPLCPLPLGSERAAHYHRRASRPPRAACYTMAATCAHQFTASAAQCGHDRGDTEPSQVSCSRRIARGRFRRGYKKLKLGRSSTRPKRQAIHGTELVGAHFGAVRSALRAKRHTSLYAPPCAARAAPRPKGSRRFRFGGRRGPWSPGSFGLRGVAMPRTSAPLRAMQCAPLCAEGGGSEQDERSVLRWRWEARHADRGAVARRGAQAGDGASRTANAIGPLARHRHGVTAALSIRAVRRRLLRLCFRPM